MTHDEAVETLRLVANAVLETVRECPDGAPEGPMYAAFVARGMSLETFEEIIKGMIDAGVVRRKGHLLFAASAA